MRLYRSSFRYFRYLYMLATLGFALKEKYRVRLHSRSFSFVDCTITAVSNDEVRQLICIEAIDVFGSSISGLPHIDIESIEFCPEVPEELLLH